jgi:hypothetical protein
MEEAYAAHDVKLPANQPAKESASRKMTYHVEDNDDYNDQLMTLMKGMHHLRI